MSFIYYSFYSSNCPPSTLSKDKTKTLLTSLLRVVVGPSYLSHICLPLFAMKLRVSMGTRDTVARIQGPVYNEQSHTLFWIFLSIRLSAHPCCTSMKYKLGVTDMGIWSHARSEVTSIKGLISLIIESMSCWRLLLATSFQQLFSVFPRKNKYTGKIFLSFTIL